MLLSALSEQQQNDAERLVEALRPQAEGLLKQVAHLLAANPGAQAFGATEVLLRGLLLSAGAGFLQTALAEKKTGTRERRLSAPAVSRPPTSTATVPGRGSSVCSAPCNSAARTITAAVAATAAAPSIHKPV